MLLGPTLPSPYSSWQFVEDDIHDIAGRVREYDKDARLVRQIGTGKLGLARWVPATPYTIGGRWAFAAEVRDPVSGEPLTGEPDPRVTICQRAFDGWHHARSRQAAYDHRKRVQEKRWRDEARQFNQIEDEEGEKAEGFVHALRKDVGVRPKAFIPRAV